jgi:hypothetical protein
MTDHMPDPHAGDELAYVEAWENRIRDDSHAGPSYENWVQPQDRDNEEDEPETVRPGPNSDPDDEPSGAGADPFGRPDPRTHPEFWCE